MTSGLHQHHTDTGKIQMGLAVRLKRVRDVLPPATGFPLA